MICPLRVKQIAQAQEDDPNLQALAAQDKYTIQLVKHTNVRKDNKLVIPAALHHWAVN